MIMKMKQKKIKIKPKTKLNYNISTNEVNDCSVVYTTQVNLKRGDDAGQVKRLNRMWLLSTDEAMKR